LLNAFKESQKGPGGGAKRILRRELCFKPEKVNRQEGARDRVSWSTGNAEKA